MVALLGLLGANLIAVGIFGEFEFWFAIIKVVTIIGMIVLGLAHHASRPASRHTASFSHLWSAGGFFPKGLKGPFLALQAVMFAFLGVELIGVTAGEAQKPGKTIPSAINKVIWRILIFYVGALAIIMSLVAWNRLNPRPEPVRDGVLQGRHPDRGRHHQLRGPHRRALLVQQRDIQHRPRCCTRSRGTVRRPPDCASSAATRSRPSE